MKALRSFPWRKHNTFTLLVDSDAFYPEMLRAIEQAQTFVYLEQYLIHSGNILDRFIEAICGAAQRGIRCYILLDDYGTREMSVTDKARLAIENIHLVYYNPFSWTQLYKSMRRNHRKLLLIDQHTAYVGGAGISDEYHSRKQPQALHWHDIVVKVQGEAVTDWFESFNDIWQDNSPIPLPPVRQRTHDTAQQRHRGRVQLARGAGRNQIMADLLNHIKKSRQTIRIATPYFLTTRKLRHALKRAARRGVDVRLLLPGEISDHRWITQAARHYYSRLLRNGVRIYEYQPRFIHAKLFLCDNWVSIGSSNLDRWNQFWNLDANQAIDAAELGNQAMQMLEQDFSLSREIDLTHWKQRGVVQRLREWWSIYIVRLIQRVVFFFAYSQKKTG